LPSDFRPDVALIELGADSLVAVELRTWFLKEVEFEVSVLKILGGASTIDLCKHAVTEMPKHLLPNLGAEPVARSEGCPTDMPLTAVNVNQLSPESLTETRDPVSN